MAKGSLGFIFVAGLLSASVAGSAPADPIRISGRVGDRQGSAVADARVTLIQMIYAEAAFVPEPKVVDEQTTAGDGTFSLTIPQGVDPKKESYVVVRKEGLSLEWVRWRFKGNQRVDIALGPGKDLAGEVVDENGQPVADAQVRISAAMSRDANRSGLVTPAFLRAQTDSRGRFIFADMPAEATFEFFVEKPGRAVVNTLQRMASIRDGCQFSPGQAGIKVILPTEAAVEGVVVAKADGRPIAGSSVVALSDSARGMLLSPRPAVSASDGAFRIGGLAAGSYIIQTSTPRDRAAEWSAEPLAVVLKTGETARGVKLEIGKGGVIEVFVADASGKAIPDASVMIHSSGSVGSSNGVTDANGLTRIRVKAGQHHLQVGKDGYTRRMVLEQVTVDDGETKRIEHTLRSLPKVTGVVRDQAGNALAGVKLQLLSRMGGEIASDAQGRFEISCNSAFLGSQDEPFILVARDVMRNLARAIDLGGREGELDIRLQPGVTIVGTVLNHDGKPLPGTQIRVLLPSPSGWLASLDRSEVGATGQDGAFEVKAIPAGRTYMVFVAADGYGEQNISFDASDLEDGRCDVGRFRLARANLSIAGVIVDVNDRPVAGADVHVDGDGQPGQLQMQAIETDAQGRFTVIGVCPGSLRVSVSVRGHAQLGGMAQVEAGATDIRIVVSDRPTRLSYVPRKPAPLKGKALPPLKDLGIDLPPNAEGRMLLLCFWDMGQRPSRNCVTQLAARATQLGEKGVVVVAVQAAKPEGDAVTRWIEENKIPFQAGQMGGDIDKTRFAWGVVSLPHLILTDREHVVVAEGFSLGDLDNQIAAAAGR